MKKVLLFGGGTGLSTLLKSLKKLNDVELTVGVAISDNGGSTGKIRDYYNIPAPGDLRRVILELASNDEIQKLYNYRFDEKLEKHTLGNLLLAALVDIKGDMDSAVQTYCEMLDIKHKIHPISNDSAHLSAMMEDGTKVLGEVEMVKDFNKIDKVFYEGETKATQEIIEAIRESDLIIFSCGSLYTSLLPNLVIDEIKKELSLSKAKVVYIANIMTEKGETTDYTLSQHIRTIEEHTDKGIVDYVICNNNFSIDDELSKRYADEGAKLVVNDTDNLEELTCIEGDYIIVDEYIRHNTDKLKNEIQKILDGE